jgi:hypothetical protein
VRSAAGMNMLETCEKSAAEMIDGVTSDSLCEETLAPFIASGAVKPIRSVTSQQRSSHTKFDAECMWRHLVPSPHGVTWRVESVGSFYMYLHRAREGAQPYHCTCQRPARPRTDPLLWLKHRYQD